MITDGRQETRSRFLQCPRHVVLAILFTCWCACLAPRTSASEKRDLSAVRVMSFNIRYGKAEDGPNHWRHRKELVIRTVQQFDPDLLGTQEMMGFQADYFKQHLPEYEVHGTSRIPSDVDQEQCSVFFRRSRFQGIDSGHFWLSETPDDAGSKSWDSSLPRMVSWMQLREREQPDTELFVFNTHFDHIGQEARLQSAALLRARIQKIAGTAPCIVTGDFNADEGSLPHQVLLYSTKSFGLQDSYRAHNPHRDPEGESTSSRWNGNRSGRRIDWILVSPQWRVSSATINDNNHEGRYPSDHYPVTAVLLRAQ